MLTGDHPILRPYIGVAHPLLRQSAKDIMDGGLLVVEEVSGKTTFELNLRLSIIEVVELWMHGFLDGRDKAIRVQSTPRSVASLSGTCFKDHC